MFCRMPFLTILSKFERQWQVTSYKLRVVEEMEGKRRHFDHLDPSTSQQARDFQQASAVAAGFHRRRPPMGGQAMADKMAGRAGQVSSER